MAGYISFLFYRKVGKDSEEWIKDFKQYCKASGIDPLINARTRKLQNISDNTGLADLGAINGLANNNALYTINVN
ncbi:18058_t:CDS:2 [Acaulospora morrowiae]|uniref:18058_t:CDS:1 n=1 Tax=Acaulospora morrowiae TaxID=94023 RepID=A0A9N8VG60_9GLOM|nr:18058_t:CDS:2 [Acaulospora morrowiae]